MWKFKILVPRIQNNEELSHWLKVTKGDDRIFIEIINGWANIESKDYLSVVDLDKLISKAPKVIQDTLKESLKFTDQLFNIFDEVHEHGSRVISKALSNNDTYILPKKWVKDIVKPLNFNKR